MIITYKHFRNKQTNKMFATKCHIQQFDNLPEISSIGIGYAVCSDKDNFSRKIGREIALKRAMKALLSKRNTLPIHRINVNTFELVGQNIFFKSIYWELDSKEK